MAAEEPKEEPPKEEAPKEEEKKEEKKPKRALLVIDMQYDFIPPNGSLKVEGGDKVVLKVNEIRKKHDDKFDLVCMSMDWHPPIHCSFHSNNVERDPTAKLFTPCKLETGQMQVMWPNHCVQGSGGAKIHKDLYRTQKDKIVLKGMDPAVDSYSAFMDNDKKTKTALMGLLKEAEIEEIVCVGLAYDYCVGNTALDGAMEGKFKTYIVKDASASVAKPSEEEIEKRFKENGVEIVNAADLDKILG
eukprot:308149_1